MSPLELFKNLSESTRLYSLLLIKQEQELCVCELMEALELSQPKISRHLALLREANLLETERRGQWIFYRLSSQLEDWAIDIIELANQQHDLTILNRRLADMGGRPERMQQCC
jgi:ArsR family transcriptional regulator|tara:strand:- start:11 stop:349 length:339 start_codon:yes stop_codon:yes gene_type:complete